MKQVFWALSLLIATVCFSQNKHKDLPAFKSGVYRNVFLEAGYSQADIDAKVEKTYHDLFEGPNRVYSEVGDSMGYVSDLKNHDARTEGLSYGMMIAVQLNKKDVFDHIWRWSKKWNAKFEPYEDGYFDPYYDGLLYLFSLMHLSGKYQIIQPHKN